MLWIFFISLLCFNLVPCVVSTFFVCKNLSDSLNLSCSYQLWTNETEDTCRIRRLAYNNPDCQTELPESPSRNIPQRGIIKLEPYYDTNGSRTVFNITFYNITWNNCKIRFRQQNTARCMTREFTIKKIVPKNKFLFYDCPWANSVFEDAVIDFEYAYGVNNMYDGKRTFSIHVPKHETLDNFNASILQNVTLFTYVETTNLYQLLYKIHTAPKHLNVTLYEIYVLTTKHNVTKTDGPFVKKADKAIFGVIDFEYETYGIPGEYVFQVRPYECFKCRYSVSPIVTIPEGSTILRIGIVGVSCLIPIFLITFYMYFKVDSGITPRVLLVTTPANDAHKKIGKSLANLLIQKYNIPTMIDIQNANINPPDWLKNSFVRATHVVILMSDDRPETSIYRNIDNLLLTLIQRNPDKICCSIKFPFTKAANLNFNVHRSFKLMDDYNAFINFIHNRGLLRRLVKKAIRNDLYYDLLKQISEYGKDTNGSCNDTPPSISQNHHSNSCNNECNDQNERNHFKNSMENHHHQDVILLNVPMSSDDDDENEKNHDEVLPDLPKNVEKCLQKIAQSKTIMRNDDSSTDSDDSSVDSDDSDMKPINPTILYLLQDTS